jgi:hypothetical protein
MEEKKGISKQWSAQVPTLAILAAAAVVGASLEALSGRLHMPGMLGLLAVATVCLSLVVIRCVPSGFPGRFDTRAVLSCVLLIHVLAVFLFFPPDVLVNRKPVVTLDHAVHYYQAVRVKSVFWRSLRMNSYDPNFMAGYPGGVIFDADMKGAELFCALLYPLSTPRALKLYIFLCYATMVFTIYRGSRLLGFSTNESLAGLLILLMYWHAGRPYAGAFRYAGMFSYIFVNHVSFYVIGLFRSFWKGGAKLWFFVAGPLAFMIHPTALVLMPIGFIGVMAMDRRHIRSIRPALLFLWCVLVVAVNAIWLVPMVRYMDVKTPSVAFFQLAGLRDVAGLLVHPGCVPAMALVAFGCGGALALVRERRFSCLVPIAGAALALVLIAAYGCRIRFIDTMEPGRFLLSFLFFLAPLAGVGLHTFLKTAGNRFPRGERRWKPAATVLLFLPPLWFSFVESKTLYKHTITTDIPEGVIDLTRIVKARTDEPGRLMVEDGPAALYGNAHLPGMLPVLSGREQIGGPYPFTFLLQHYATFQTDKAFGRPLAAFSASEFDSCLATYNVRFILSATKSAASFLQTLPSVSPIETSGRYSLWGVKGGFGPAFETAVRVSAAQNRITVTGGDHHSRVVLKYHWDRGLHVAGPAKIYPVTVGTDPVPFIGLDPHGVHEVNIEYE